MSSPLPSCSKLSFLESRLSFKIDYDEHTQKLLVKLTAKSRILSSYLTNPSSNHDFIKWSVGVSVCFSFKIVDLVRSVLIANTKLPCRRMSHRNGSPSIKTLNTCNFESHRTILQQSATKTLSFSSTIRPEGSSKLSGLAAWWWVLRSTIYTFFRPVSEI